MDEGEIKNEVMIKNSDIKKFDLNLIKAIKSICKTVYERRYGTGFFIKLEKDDKELYCLITNEHVKKKEMIENKKIIDIYYFHDDYNEKKNTNKIG